MPVTMKQVIDSLLPEEPDYAAAAALGPEALPLLQQLVQGDNRELATKAASLAGHIAGPEAVAVLNLAASSPVASVRVAAAAATRHLPTDQASRVLTGLVGDGDPGVRKIAMSAVPPDAGGQLRAAVAQAGPQATVAPPMGREREADNGAPDGGGPPMVDPEAPEGNGGDRAAAQGGQVLPPEEPGDEEPDYPTVGSAEDESDVEAPPGAAGY